MAGQFHGICGSASVTRLVMRKGFLSAEVSPLKPQPSRGD
jgi:hypothetical protein